MKKVLIQTYESSLKTDKEKLLSSYLLYNVLHCLSEIKTLLFHTGICNFAITVLYLLEWQFKNLNLLIFIFFFLSRGNKLSVSFSVSYSFYLKLFNFTVTPGFYFNP